MDADESMVSGERGVGELTPYNLEDLDADMCDIADHQICIDASDCHHCKLHKFWDKQYRKKKVKKEEKK